jgi:hypothetical protein
LRWSHIAINFSGCILRHFRALFLLHQLILNLTLLTWLDSVGVYKVLWRPEI